MEILESKHVYVEYKSHVVDYSHAVPGGSLEWTAGEDVPNYHARESAVHRQPEIVETSRREQRQATPQTANGS